MPENVEVGPPAAPAKARTPGPKTKADQQHPNDFGPNNAQMANLWPEGVQWLRKLVYQYEAETSVARRDKLKRIRRAREFWKGSQFLYYDELAQRWKIPGQDAVSQKQADLLPRYQFITNIYQAYGLTLISILSQGNPITQWLPVDPNNPTDVATADQASKIARLFRRNNNLQDLLIDVLYYFFNDGPAYAYVRYVEDEDEYGTTTIQPKEAVETEIGESEAKCSICGWAGLTPDRGPSGQPECPQCHAPLPDDAIQPPPTAPLPTASGPPEEFANGCEKVTIVSDLEMVAPVYAPSMSEMPFLTWTTEVHKSKLQATYEWIRNKLEDQYGGEMGDTTARAQEKQTRVSLLESSSQSSRIGSELASSLVTFRKTWFAPWAFEAIKDEKERLRMYQVFPKGAMVAFAGDTYCESNSERMRDHWRICHAFPGEGQNREAVGASLIPVQRQCNTIRNIIMESIEYGVPAMFIDDQVVNTQAFNEAGAIPGLNFPAAARAGQSLEGSFYQTKPATVSEQAVEYLHALENDVAQFLMGAFPALFGGNTGENVTFHGIAEQRDQALGRLGMIWRRIVAFLAEIDYLGVCNYIEAVKDGKRPKEVAFAIAGDAGVVDASYIELDDLEGNVHAYGDPSETYPITFDKKREAIESLADSKNPEISGLFSKPSNITAWVRYHGMADEIEIPGESQREAELHKIREMIKPGTVPMGPTGQPMLQPGPNGAPGTTDPVDPMIDDPKTIVDTIMEWAASDHGQATRQMNPTGFDNVKGRLVQAKNILMLANAPPPSPPGGGAAAGGGGGGGAAPAPQPPIPPPAGPSPTGAPGPM